MHREKSLYTKYKDPHGEKYYCPVGALDNHPLVGEEDIIDCVEVSTTGRYAGHIDVVTGSPHQERSRHGRTLE